MYWAAAALLCGATMVGFASCSDDDDDKPGTTTTTGDLTKPVQGTDFTVTTEGNSTTISTTLTYGKMYVIFNGVEFNLVDGKVKIDLPVAGDYKMTFNIYESGKSVSSDEFTVTITATDLSFLDNSAILKALTGGKAVYEAANGDDNGKFTRTWRIDDFYNGDFNYFKSGSKVGGVGFYGGDWWACAGSYKGSWQQAGDFGEHASISFDFVTNKVKFEVEDETVCDTVGQEFSGHALGKGVYYAPFTYEVVNEVYEYAAGAAEQITNNTGLDLANQYIKISIGKVGIGDNGYVHMPINQLYSVTESIQEKDRREFVLTTNADGTVALATLVRSWDGDPQGEASPCALLFQYVCDEYDAAGKYTYETEDHFEAPDRPAIASAQVASGVYKLSNIPPADYYSWIDLKMGNAAGDTPSAETYASNMCAWWCYGNPDATTGANASVGAARHKVAMDAVAKETIEFADGVIKIHYAAPKANYWGTDEEANSTEINEEEIEVAFTFADGVYTFESPIKLYTPNANFSAISEAYVIEGVDGIFFGFDDINADEKKYQTPGFYLVK